MGDMAGRLTRLEASRPTLSRAGRWLVGLTFPWILAATVLVRLLDSATDLGSPQRLVVIAVYAVLAGGPLLLAGVAVTARQARWMRPRWLFGWPQPRADIGPDGLALWSPVSDVRRFAWDEVGSLSVTSPWLRAGELRAPDGTLLATVPAGLMHPRMVGRHPRTLAEWIVDARPDRFILVDRGPSEPDAFELANT